MPLYRVFLFSLLILAASLSCVIAQDKPAGKVHGYVFGDYFYKFAGDSTGNGSQYSSLRKDEQAFQFRRLYLYYDHNISETFFAQFLLEGNDKVFTGERHGIFIKTAYLEWKNLIPMGSLAFGLVPTPTWAWGLSERTWAHRFIEKTVADFRGLGRASDIGVAVRGRFVEDGTLGYNAMIGNGRGQGEEIDKYKNFYAALNSKPTKEILLEVQGEFENARNDSNKILLKGFAAYQTKEFTIGGEVVQRTLKKAGTQGADVTRLGISLFAWLPIPGMEKFRAFARFDYFDPNTKVTDRGWKENFFLFGIDYMPIKDIHIAPNIWINTYSDKSPAKVKRDPDVVGRITFFYIYK